MGYMFQKAQVRQAVNEKMLLPRPLKAAFVGGLLGVRAAASGRVHAAHGRKGLLAQMLLRSEQYDLLPREARKHGLRSLIRYFIRMVARLVRASDRWRLDFAKSNFHIV